MESLGLRAELTVEQVQQALNVNPETASLCIAGQRLPEQSKMKLKELIDVNGTSEVCVCPRVTWGEEFLCCPEAVLRQKPKAKLGLERFLTVWILLAAGAGVLLGYYTSLDKKIEALKVGNTNLLSAIGMIAMLLPPFAAVKYNEFTSAVRRIPKRIAVLSLVMNWIVGPFLMLGLGMVTLSGHPDLLQGVVFIGAARCIAMVLVWTSLADGDSFLCVSLVLLNSLITIVGYAPIVTLLAAVGQAAGINIEGNVSFMTVFINVAIYLGIPLVIGIFMWSCGHGKEWYWKRFLPRFAPVGLISLLVVVFLMFCEMAKPLLNGQVSIVDVLFAVIPLLLYFSLMFGLSWACSRLLKLGFPETVTLAFTGASNNFELALASCTAIFGTSSNQAIATVLGPLIEIPVMLLMVRVSGCLRFEKEVQGSESSDTDETTATSPNSSPVHAGHVCGQPAMLLQAADRVISDCSSSLAAEMFSKEFGSTVGSVAVVAVALEGNMDEDLSESSSREAKGVGVALELGGIIIVQYIATELLARSAVPSEPSTARSVVASEARGSLREATAENGLDASHTAEPEARESSREDTAENGLDVPPTAEPEARESSREDKDENGLDVPRTAEPEVRESREDTAENGLDVPPTAEPEAENGFDVLHTMEPEAARQKCNELEKTSEKNRPKTASMPYLRSCRHQEMDVLAASLTAGLEIPAKDGDVATEASALLKFRLDEFFAVHGDLGGRDGYCSRWPHWLRSRQGEAGEASEEEMQEMQALVATEPSRPAEEDTPRSGASGHTSAGTSELDLATELVHAACQAHDTPQEAMSVVVSQATVSVDTETMLRSLEATIPAEPLPKSKEELPPGGKLWLEEVDVLAASLTDGLEPGFSRPSGPPSEASPGDLSELYRETYDCSLQVTIMLEHIPKTKDELPLDCRSWVTAGRDAFSRLDAEPRLQEMDVLAASLTAGLDASPGEDRAEGDPEAEASMLSQATIFLEQVPKSQDELHAEMNVLAASLTAGLTDLPSKNHVEDDAAEVATLAPEQEEMQEMQALVASEPSPPAEEARDTPRSGASGVSLLERHTSAGTSELDLATDCRALQSGFPIKQQQQELVHAACQAQDTPQEAMSVVVSQDEATIPAEPLPKSKEELPPGGKLWLEEVDVLAASLTDGLEPGFSRPSGPPSEASPGDLSELYRETYDCSLQVTIMLEHIPKTKDELLQEMDVLAASLTAGLDSSPGEDRAEGDPEAEAPMLLQATIFLEQVPKSQDELHAEMNVLAASLTAGLTDLPSKSHVEDDAAEVATLAPEQEEMQEMQALVATEPAPPAEEARDTPRSGASGHTSAGTSELDLATDCRALQSGFPIKQQQQELVHAACQAQDTPQEAMSVVVSQATAIDATEVVVSLQVEDLVWLLRLPDFRRDVRTAVGEGGKTQSAKSELSSPDRVREELVHTACQAGDTPQEALSVVVSQATIIIETTADAAVTGAVQSVQDAIVASGQMKGSNSDLFDRPAQ
ncbi:arsB, partial [Symbiodinium sp. KB8]